MNVVLVLAVCALGVACGQRPAQTGITTDRLGLVKTRLGAAPGDLAARVVGGRRDRRAQLVGDPAPERLLRLPLSDTLEVRDAAGVRIAAVTTPFHITDFETVSAADGSPRLVVSTYPNARAGSTFTVLDGGLREVARWEEFPAASRFATASWRGGPAVFYLQGDVLVVRADDGRPLARVPVPGGAIFREVHVLDMAADRLALVASGSGYTPFHLVAVFASGQLAFHEIGDEHAFDLSAAAGGFVVATRSTRWAYRVPGG